MTRILFPALLIIFSALPAFGQQDSIVLLNGRVYRGTVKAVSNELLTYVDAAEPDTEFPFEITTDRLFSYVVNGQETVVYKQDELKGDFLTVEQARHATLGSYDARQTFKPRFVFWSSVLIGYGVSLMDTYYSQRAYDQFVAENGVPPTKSVVGFFGTGPSLMPVVAPLVLSVSWGLPTFRIKSDQILQKDLFGNEDYYRGFHRVAKQKRVFAAIKGSTIGIAAGIISYSIFRIN